jgi:hypothetical protein
MISAMNYESNQMTYFIFYNLATVTTILYLNLIYTKAIIEKKLFFSVKLVEF